MSSVSGHCLKDLWNAFHNTSGHFISPYRDASGHVPPGVLQGNLAWLGNYDQCQRLDNGMYCLADLTTTLPQQEQNSTQELLIRLGLCAVSSCNSSVIKDNIQTILNETGVLPTWLNITHSEVNCTQHLPFTAGFIATVVLLSVLCLLCITGTVLQLYRKHRPIRKYIHCIDHDGPHTVTPPRSTSDEDSPIVSQTQSMIQEDEGISNVSVLREALRDKPGKCYQILTCFSIPKNLQQILSTGTSDRTVTCLHGIRFCSIAWIILGHTFLAIFSTNIMVNPQSALEYPKRLSWQAVGNAYFAVDTFFFLSGLLVVYMGLAEMEKREGKLPFLKYYLHRYIRLTPTMTVSMLFWMYIKPYLGSGPLWFQMQTDPLCDQYWWTNLLYIQNFYPTELEHECIGWTWYLALDMQFYIIAPVLLVILYRNVKGGLVVASCVTILSVIVSAVLIYVYNIQVNLTLSVINMEHSAAEAFESIIYGKPYCRISVYVIGMLVGYVLHTHPTGSLGIQKVYYFLGWLLSTAVALALIFGLYPTFHGHTFGLAENILYGSLSHVGWGLVLCWVVYACHYGAVGFINDFLSWRGFIPLSRLTYTLYLTHPLVMFIFYNSLKTTIYISDINIAVYYSSMLVLSLAASLVLMLLIQMPVFNLERVLGKKQKQT